MESSSHAVAGKSRRGFRYLKLVLILYAVSYLTLSRVGMVMWPDDRRPYDLPGYRYLPPSKSFLYLGQGRAADQVIACFYLPIQALDQFILRSRPLFDLNEYERQVKEEGYLRKAASPSQPEQPH